MINVDNIISCDQLHLIVKHGQILMKPMGTITLYGVHTFFLSRSLSFLSTTRFSSLIYPFACPFFSILCPFHSLALVVRFLVITFPAVTLAKMFSLNTTVDDSSPMIAYDGIWEAFGPSTAGSDLYHEGSFTSTWTHSASASIRFNGTSVFVYGGKRSSYGEFVVTLDGTNTTLSAFSPNAMENSTLLFNATGMEQSWHTLTITNIGMTGKKGMDIDYITWISNITEVSSPTSTNTSVYPIPSLITYDASMSEFSWLPHNAWQQNPESTSGGRTTSMNNANVSLTFQGQAISLIGPIGSNYSSTYTVSLDGSHPRTFSGSGRINRTALLYHADNLGPGNHTIIITNRGDITPVTGATSVRDVHARQTGTGSQNFFGVDQAQIWQGDIVTTPTPSIPPSAPPHICLRLQKVNRKIILVPVLLWA
jgi:hypothetical protein